MAPVDTTSRTIVVGGGLVGLCTGLYLQQGGRSVSILERSTPGDGASGHNSGIIASGSVPIATPGIVRKVPHMLRDPLAPLAIRWSYLPSIAPWLTRFVWASRPNRVEAISIALQSILELAREAYEPIVADGYTTGLVHEGGFLYAYLSDKAFDGARFGMDLRSRRGVTQRVLEEHAIEDFDPALAGRFKRAIHLPESWFTSDPYGFTTALSTKFSAQGGQVQRTEVIDFDVTGPRVRAVVTTSGRLPADTVVIAAGAWSRRLVRKLGMDVPLDTERGYGVDLPEPGVRPRIPFVNGDYNVAFTPTDRGLRVSGTVELGGLTAPPNYARADKLVRVAKVIFPELVTRGATQFMSYRPSMPDSMPVIGRAGKFENVYLAFGHGHLGLSLAAITGRLIAELADGRTPTIDVEPFRPERFLIWGRRANRQLASAAQVRNQT